MISPTKLQKMLNCSSLLPAPGDEVAKELIEEIFRLRKALEIISNPIAFFQQKAEQDGNLIDGLLAVELSESHVFLQTLASEALDFDEE